jgi:hypothetical protein
MSLVRKVEMYSELERRQGKVWIKNIKVCQKVTPCHTAFKARGKMQIRRE